MKFKLRTIFDTCINIVIAGCILYILLLLIRCFLIIPAYVPSNSMWPILYTGDHLLVNKLIPGGRCFNFFKVLRGENTKIYRLPGWRTVERNDILVFHNPYPRHVSQIKMAWNDCYVKRCVAIPGDTVQILKYIFYVNHQKVWDQSDEPLKQEKLPFQDLMNSLYFPADSTIGWNKENFGPLFVPKAGSHIVMNGLHFILYRKIIEWEQQKTLSLRGDTVYLGNKGLKEYTFSHNYYFMVGDNHSRSDDSRYWGLLPDDFIIGKVWCIWNSVCPDNKHVYWGRIGLSPI